MSSVYGVPVSEIRRMRRAAPIHVGRRSEVIEELLAKNVEMSVQSLAREMGVSYETTQRTLQRMAEAGQASRRLLPPDETGGRLALWSLTT